MEVPNNWIKFGVGDAVEKKQECSQDYQVADVPGNRALSSSYYCGAFKKW